MTSRDEKIAAMKYRAQQDRIRAPRHTEAYRHVYPCPRCGSDETGTDSVATSAYWMVFMCGCGHKWRKKSDTVSEASAGLRKMFEKFKGGGF